MLKKLLNRKFNTITSAAIVLGAASLFSRAFGLIRDIFLTSSFGLGYELDVFLAAFRIPDLVFYLVVLGAVSAGLIPVFVDYLNKDKKQAWYLINNLINIMFVILVVACVVLILIAPWMMKFIVPGFSEDQLAQTVDLTRVMFLSPLFLGLSAVFGGVLQSFRRFLVYALAPVLYNIGIIFGAVVLVKYFGLMGLAYGVVLGAFLHFLIQLSFARVCGFKWKLSFDYKSKGIRRIFRVMPPRTMGLALNQANIIFMTVIASTLATGSIAAYTVAYNIWAVPLGIFGISFVTASFPKLSEEAQKKDVLKFLKTFTSTARQILFLTVPAAALFIVLRAQLVRVLFGRGLFDWNDTVITLDTLAYFCIGLFAEALVWLFLRGFFAWEDAKTPFILGLISTVIRLSAAWYFAIYTSLGVAGLALGFSLGSLVYLFLLFIFMSKKLIANSKKDKEAIVKTEKKFFVAGTKMIFAAFLAGVAAYFALRPLSSLVNMQTGFGVLIQGGLAGLSGLLVYFFFGWLFKIKELRLLFDNLMRRWPLKKVPPEISEVNGK